MISSLIRFCGSLGLGIAILCLLVVLLAWGTLIESEYGPAVSKFVLYNNPGFALLLLLLVLNVTCSLLSRLPWKKHHLPFLLAHGGIIILLMGCFVTWRCGLEAQITLAEGHAGNKAIQMDRQHFAVTCFSHDGVETQSTFQVPFTPGPFNWEDFGQNKVASVSDQTGKYRTSLGLAMRWGRRDQGPLKTQRPDIQIEVLDYLAASTVETVPPLELSVRWKKSIMYQP